MRWRNANEGVWRANVCSTLYSLSWYRRRVDELLGYNNRQVEEIRRLRRILNNLRVDPDDPDSGHPFEGSSRVDEGKA